MFQSDWKQQFSCYIITSQKQDHVIVNRPLKGWNVDCKLHVVLGDGLLGAFKSISYIVSEHNQEMSRLLNNPKYNSWPRDVLHYLLNDCLLRFGPQLHWWIDELCSSCRFAFSRSYRRYSKLIVKYNAGFISLLEQGISESLLYGDLVYKT